MKEIKWQLALRDLCAHRGWDPPIYDMSYNSPRCCVKIKAHEYSFRSTWNIDREQTKERLSQAAFNHLVTI
ncbi:hypothetical protein HI914_06730 [Erysiphe necator]|nr:hypothetical protein HI914_06730 [Erysiphe necator]